MRDSTPNSTASFPVEILQSANALFAIYLVKLVVGMAHVAASVESWVVLVLSAKPLLDLTWRWRWFQFSGQGVNLQSIIGVVVVGLTVAALIVRGREVVRIPQVTALLVLAVVSLIVTPSGAGVNELLRLGAGLSFFFTAGLVLSDPERFDRFARLFLAAVLVPIVLSYAQLAGLLPFEYFDVIDGVQQGRASGTYQQPLGLIYFLVYAFPFALYLRDRYPRSRTSRLALGFIIVTLPALFFTYDRTAFIALSLECLLWFVLTRPRPGRILFWAGAAAGVVGIIAAGWLANVFAGALGQSAGWSGIITPDFLRGRGMMWYVFLSSLYNSNPLLWLIGRGGSLASGLVPGFGMLTSDEAHNDYIRILHAYGLLGLGFYLGIMVHVFRRALLLRRQHDQFSRSLGAMTVSIIVALLLFSITTEPSRYPTGIWYFFALASIVEVRARAVTAHLRNGTSGAPGDGWVG